MSFPKYEKYKDSGVEWLGEVPEHWEVWKLARAFSEIGSGTTPSTTNYDYYDGGDIPWVITGDLNDGRLNQTSKHITNKAISEHTSLRIYPPGSLVFAMYGATIGKVALLELEATVNQACCVFGVESTILPEYLYYWFLGMKQPLVALASGGGQPNLSQDSLRGLRVAAPDKPEQSAVAAFLDRETVKIDALVEEQRRLIDLLKEKRQAVISHAVTKGLNPDAPMKDSGVEWLGEVPEHWNVMPIRYAARLESGHTPSRSKPEWWVDCDIPWISLSDVWQIRNGRSIYINETKEKVSELGLANSAARLLPKGTVVLSRTASVGFSGIMGSDMATTQDFANWVPADKVLSEYLLYSFRSMTLEFERLKYGSTHNTIYMPDIISMRFVLPPLDEQEEIVEYITECIGTIDHLSDEAKRMIDILQERRTALISAAVTGKIDVRNHAPTREGVPA